MNAWEPRAETVPLHAWLHPWLPLLGPELEDLYPGIRFRLASALQQWHPSDASALALLSPWHTVRLALTINPLPGVRAAAVAPLPRVRFRSAGRPGTRCGPTLTLSQRACFKQAPASLTPRTGMPKLAWALRNTLAIGQC